MADFPAQVDDRFSGLDELFITGNTYDIDAPSNTRTALDPFANHLSFGTVEYKGTPKPIEVCRLVQETSAALGDTWYEIIHVFPLRIDLGNILTTTLTSIYIYNADRFNSHTFDVFTNNTGDGTSITDLPSLPETLPSQSQITLTYEVTTQGPPTIDGTLDFEFDLYTVMVPVTGTRIVMFPYRPEIPVRERLQFLTDIMPLKDGREQRMGLRTYPRQLFDLTFKILETDDQPSFDNLMFDWQSRVFGLPVWHEMTVTTSDVSSGATVIPVSNTAYADYRVGSLAIIISDNETFDALEVASFNSNSVTFASPIGRDYPEGTEVMPLRSAFGSENNRGRRYPVNLSERRISFQVIDNDVGSSFADATPYIAAGTGLTDVDGSVLLDDPNWLKSGTLEENYEKSIVEVDGQTGKRYVDSPWDKHKRQHSKGFVTVNRESLWNVRRLLHYLNGQRVSFWIPTFWRNLEPNDTLVQGTTPLLIRNIGYSRFVRNRENRRLIRIRALDNLNAWLYREITASTEVDSTTEQLTVDTAWDITRQPADILRVEYLSRVRISSDEIELEHDDASGSCKITFPIVEVFTE